VIVMSPVRSLLSICTGPFLRSMSKTQMLLCCSGCPRLWA
jgi:hypothetical protein